jgi:uncharacterized protein
MLSFEKARILLDYVLQHRDYPLDVHYSLVIGFYGGEPLLNMQFIRQAVDYIETMPDVQKYVSYNMTTNAILLDRYMDFLVEKQFYLAISFDGDRTGQSYRVDHSGNNSFDRVFRNVKLLQEKYPVFFHEKVSFHAVLHNRNSVESTFRFINDNFAKTPTIASLSGSGVNKEHISEFREMFQNVSESYQKSNNCASLDAEMFLRSPRIAALSAYIHRQSGNIFDTYNDLIFDLSNSTNFLTGTCTPFSKKLFVTVNGKLLPCERIDQSFVLGQLLDDRVELFDFETIAENHNRYISKLTEQCKVCGSNKDCLQCVYHIEDICEDKVRCPKFCTKEKQEQDIDAIFDYLREQPQYYQRILKEVFIK